MKKTRIRRRRRRKKKKMTKRRKMTRTTKTTRALKKLTLFSSLKNYSIRKIVKSYFKKRVSDVEKDHVDLLNISKFEKNEIISSANKKDVNEIFTLITKTYILA